MAAQTDIAVVGAGIVGLSTAFAALQHGLSVTVYDAAPPGSGQSAGQSRLFRHAHDDLRLVAMAAESRALWRTWEDELGLELVSDDGAIAIGPAVEQRLRVLGAFPHLGARLIDAAELADRLPLLAAYEGAAMLDEGGGAIRTRDTITALAERLGERLVPEHVLALRPRRSGVEIRTATRFREHAHAIVCAGRGTPALARGSGLSIPVEHGVHVRLTYALRGEPPKRVSTLQDSSGAFGETGVYAAAHPGNRHYSVGLSAHVLGGEDGSLTDPAGLAAISERTTAYVARALPGLEPTPVDYVHCPVTELPWGSDAVAVWRTPGASFLVGHNLFKHAPILGHDLVRSVLDGRLRDDLEPRARLGDPTYA